jgi:xanthine dehydrogenase accessory factor
MPNETALEVLQAAVRTLEAGQRAALLTVVHVAGSTPRRAGAKMLVLEDGTSIGTIGGGTMEERAVLDARQELKAGGAALRRYDISGQANDSLGLCGGSMDVAIDVLIPAPRLVVIGAGHIAQPLAAMASMIGMDVIIIDDRPEWATPARFPTAREIHVVAYDRASETLQPLPVQITASTAVVLATWGWDGPALRQLLPTPAFYIGLVASRRKLRLLADQMNQAGIDPQAMERVHAPVGLDLGGDTPGQIALSIIAEIQLIRAGATGQPLTSLRQVK